MGRKRDRHYISSSSSSTRQDRPPFPKRRRPPPQPADDEPVAKLPPPPALLVTGLPDGCSVLDLKSRFEIYGSISRIRIDRDGVGYVCFRTRDAGDAAVAASLEPSFGISIESKRLQVLWATDPLAKWREGVVGIGTRDNARPSKLLRGELPLSRRGRGSSYKLSSGIVITGVSDSVDDNNDNGGSDGNNDNGGSDGNGLVSSVLDAPFKAREIVAYDDIL